MEIIAVTTPLVLHRHLDLVPPDLTMLQATDVPQPYRHLLVHAGDMTGRLESFYGERVHLRTLKAVQGPKKLYRQVLLLTEGDRIVEYGVIQISLDFFEGEPLQRILGCYQPLGGILNEFGIGYRSDLEGFFRIHADEPLRAVWDLQGEHALYGRQNRLLGDDDRTIAEVVEILPPTPERAGIDPT